MVIRDDIPVGADDHARPAALALARLLGLLLNPLFLTALRRFTLVAPMDNWDYPIWECWLIGLGWLAASTLLGLLLFQRREIN